MQNENEKLRQALIKALNKIDALESDLSSLNETNSSSDIAVVGIACKLPGGVSCHEQLWQLLINGKSAINSIKNKRFPETCFLKGDEQDKPKISSSYAGLVESVYAFDPYFFGISQAEAIDLDPQQRMLLELSWHAFEDAGMPIEKIKGAHCGVFIGIGSNDYGSALITDLDNITPYMASGNSLSMSAGRLSYFYDFTGPSMAIDTACSSSLVAIHEASQKLNNKDCDFALVGGVNCILTPGASINFSMAGMLARDSKLKVFDQDAAGYIRGEGGVVFILKRYIDAVKDKDNIYAVIKGSSINHDGRTSGLTVPSSLAQQAVISNAIEKAGCSIDKIAYVEAHGTGTSLGDPIEVNALAKLFNKDKKAGSLFVGSIKANIGHLEASAGIAGLLKSILIAKHKTIPPQINFCQLNKKINLTNSNVEVNTSSVKFDEGEELYVGTSSFGFSGTNAHVILHSPESEKQVITNQAGSNSDDFFFFTVSAKSKKTLKTYIENLLGYIESKKLLSLSEICFTAAFSRSHFSERYAAYVKSVDELKKRLIEYDDSLIVGGYNPEIKLFLNFSACDIVVLNEIIDSFRLISPQLYLSLNAYKSQYESNLFVAKSVVFYGVVNFLLSQQINLTELLCDEFAWSDLEGVNSYQEFYTALDLKSAKDRPLSSINSVDEGLWVEINCNQNDAVKTKRIELSGSLAVYKLVEYLYMMGASLSFELMHHCEVARLLDYPKYPFQKRFYKSRSIDSLLSNGRRSIVVANKPLFKSVEYLSESKLHCILSFENYFELLLEHKVNGEIILPGALILEVFLSAVAFVAPASQQSFNVKFHSPAVLKDKSTNFLVLVENLFGKCFVKLYGVYGTDVKVDASLLKAEATVVISSESSSVELRYMMPDLTNGFEEKDVAYLYKKSVDNGISLGESFQKLKKLYANGADLFAVIANDQQDCNGGIHLTSLDAVFQSIVAVDVIGDSESLILTNIEQGQYFSQPCEELFVNVKLIDSSELMGVKKFNFNVFNPDGRAVADFNGVCFKRFDRVGRSHDVGSLSLYGLTWNELSPSFNCLDVSALFQSEKNINQLNATATSLADKCNLCQYDRFRSAIESYCAYGVINSLTDLGWSPAAGNQFDVSTLAEQLCVVPSQRNLLGRMLNILCNEGLIKKEGGNFVMQEACMSEEKKPLDVALFEEYAEEKCFVDRCLGSLADVLKGEKNPLEVLFSTENFEGTESVYTSSPISKVLNELIAKYLQLILTGDRPLRILEIGAGIGGTTQNLLPVLGRSSNIIYYFTDISQHFIDQARLKFTDFSFINYALLDIEKDPISQGRSLFEFDVVIASNVIHAVKYLDDALQHINILLKPGGSLVLRECIKSMRSSDLTFGMTKGWWAFDDFRKSNGSPLLSVERWKQLLSEYNFTQIEGFLPTPLSAEAVILAQRDIVLHCKVWVVFHYGAQSSIDFIDYIKQHNQEVCSIDLTDYIELSLSDQKLKLQEAITYFDKGIDKAIILTSNKHDMDLALKAAMEKLEQVTLVYQLIAESKLFKNCKVWLATQNGESFSDATCSIPVNLDQSLFSSIAKVFALSFPELMGGLVDLDVKQNSDDLAFIYGCVTTEVPYRYLTFRNNQVYSVALSKFDDVAVQAQQHFTSQDTVLVAGGLGGIGYALVKGLMKLNVKNIIILSRTVNSKSKQDRIRELQAKNSNVSVLECDIANSQQLKQVLDTLLADSVKVSHVFHCAGDGGDAEFCEASLSDHGNILSAKIDGAWNLHQLTNGFPIKSFVMLSSMVSLWGAKNKLHYAMANSFLDRLAAFRQASGLPAISFNLGPVNTGMLDEAGKQSAESIGANLIDLQELVGSILSQANANYSQIALLNMDWSKLKLAFGFTWLEKFFSELNLGLPNKDSIESKPIADNFLQVDFSALDHASKLQYIESIVQAALVDVLSIDEVPVSIGSVGFHDLGLDSLLSIRYINKINENIGCHLSSIDAIDYPTVKQLSMYILTKIDGELENSNVEGNNNNNVDNVAYSNEKIDIAQDYNDLKKLLDEV